MNIADFFLRTLSGKIVLIFSFIVFLVVLIISTISIFSSSSALEKKAFLQLETVNQIKRNQIQDFFNDKIHQIENEVQRKEIITALKLLNKYHTEKNISATKRFDTGDSESETTQNYSEVYQSINKYLASFGEIYEYHDVFLLCQEHGHIMYSNKKEKDFGSNLSFGRYKNTHLAETWRKTKDSYTPIFTDMKGYSPSNNMPSMFLGCSVIEDEEYLGVLVLQISSKQINEIMQERSGLGYSGESYLIGQDLLMRSDSRFVNNSTILKRKVDTIASQCVNNNTNGKGIIKDYRDIKVLSVYSHCGLNELQYVDFEWAIISEIDELEIDKPVVELRNRILFAAVVSLIGAVFFAMIFGSTLSKPIHVLINTADKIAKGKINTKIDIETSDEIGKLGESINMMTDQLVKYLKKNDNQLWISKGVTSIGKIIRGKSDLNSIANLLCQFFAEQLNAQIISFYIIDVNCLKLTGSYAFNKRKNISDKFEIGEGLIGQAALEKQIISIQNIPDDYIRINSSIGDSKPKNIVVVPYLHKDRVQGVMEIGSFEEISDLKLEFLEKTVELIGISINSIKDESLTKNLLEETQKQSKKLQVHQEELKAANENLEEQTQMLQQSEEELKQQSEELRVANDTLDEKQKLLVKNYDDLEWSKWELEAKSEELKQSSKYKSEFMANMSHEFRTPLNSLLLLSKDLAKNKRGNLDESEVEDARVIYEGGKDLLNLINDIMDLSKVEAGKLDITIEEVKLESICSNMHRIFDPIAKVRNNIFETSMDADVPQIIQTDSHRMEQILKNLLSNALKFTKNGSVSLEIKLSASNNKIEFRNKNLTKDSVISISVIDTGIGIAENMHKTIFDAFKQEDGTTSRKFGGTGLGLAISKELSELLGGEIHLSSSQGKGSQFTLYLPITNKGSFFSDHSEIDMFSTLDEIDLKYTEKRKNSAVEINFSNDSEDNSINLETSNDDEIDTINRVTKNDDSSSIDDRNDIQEGDKKILIIDDDYNYSKTLLSHCKKNNYKCLIAEDGRSGILLARNFKPDGILLDLGLPDIKGTEVLKQLKYSLSTRHIPVQIISGNDADKNELRLQGALGFLMKPVSEEQLNSVLLDIGNIRHKKISKILIVEDDEVSRKCISKIIENSGLSSKSVDSGNEGYKEIMSFEYDCVILDLDLPDISGFELLKRINSDSIREKLPSIIIYTGKEISDEEHRELNKYSTAIIIKGSGSSERLLDDVSLFLHTIDTKLEDDSRKIIRMLHDEDKMLKGRKILLVDDDMRNSYALSKQLITIGLDVEMAANGKLAMDLIKKDMSFEMILMDIMMPIMDGYIATKLIRKIPEYKNIPILALTAKAMPEDKHKCIEAGASEYLEKPIDFEKLLSVIRVWLFKY